MFIWIEVNAFIPIFNSFLLFPLHLFILLPIPLVLHLFFTFGNAAAITRQTVPQYEQNRFVNVKWSRQRQNEWRGHLKWLKLSVEIYLCTHHFLCYEYRVEFWVKMYTFSLLSSFTLCWYDWYKWVFGYFPLNRSVPILVDFFSFSPRCFSFALRFASFRLNWYFITLSTRSIHPQSNEIKMGTREPSNIQTKTITEQKEYIPMQHQQPFTIITLNLFLHLSVLLFCWKIFVKTFISLEI